MRRCRCSHNYPLALTTESSQTVSMRPHGSFSDFVRKSSCPCAAARPRRIEVAASSVHASQRDASESHSLPHDPHHIPQLLHHLRRKQAKSTWSSTLASVPPKQRPN